jgi:hypothetical protein
MKRLQRAAVLIELTERLRKEGMWCRDTHLQKVTYFLQEGAAVPLGFTFVYYGAAPYAVGLQEDLEGLLADGVLEFQNNPDVTAVHLEVTDRGRRLLERFPKTLRQYHAQIWGVAEQLTANARDLGELEALSTALYVLKKRPVSSDGNLIGRICELSPHLSQGAAWEALRATREVVQALGAPKTGTHG